MYQKKGKWIKLVCIFLALSTLILLSGCGANKPAQQADSTTASQTTGAESETKEAPEEITVAWISYSLNDDWFKAVYNLAVEEAKRIEKEDNVKFVFQPLDSMGKEESQLAIVEDIITKGEADIVYFEPVNEKAMASAVEKLNKEMDVPVGAAGITASGGKYLYVGLDNVAATKQCGDAMIKLLNAKYKDPEGWAKAGGIIIELWGPPGLQITQDRHAGFRQALDPIVEKTEGLQIVDLTTNWDPATALEVMNDAIQRYGDKIIAVYSHDDTSATEGAWRAFETAGMGYKVGDPKHIPIVTYDGTMNGMRHVREGHVDMITEQPAFAYGSLVMRYLYNWYRDGYDSLPKVGTTLNYDELSKIFPEEAGTKFWSPVQVKNPINWEGIWLAPKSPIIPDEVSPTEKYQWGNYMYFLANGKYPE